MPNYKITYESDTIEGLKAIQGSFLGQGASATDLTTENTVPPPPRLQDEKNVDAFSGVVQAPPIADEAGASLDKNAYYPPPPIGADSATMDIGLEGEIPPPPKDELQDQEGNEELVPPQKSGSKKSEST